MLMSHTSLSVGILRNPLKFYVTALRNTQITQHILNTPFSTYCVQLFVIERSLTHNSHKVFGVKFS